MSIGARITTMGMRATRFIFGPRKPSLRVFQTNFDKLSDFAGMYITPPGELNTTHSIIAGSPPFHRASIISANDSDNQSIHGYIPHRGYPTVQLYKLPGGAFGPRCLIRLKLKAEIGLFSRGVNKINDWFSPGTATGDETDAWKDVNTWAMGPEGYMGLEHVPTFNETVRTYQAGPDNDPNGLLKFPFGEVVQLESYLDTTPGAGEVELFQNSFLISSAALLNGLGRVAQLHFGVYASAAVASGYVENYKLEIREVRNKAEARALIAASW